MNKQKYNREEPQRGESTLGLESFTDVFYKGPRQFKRALDTGLGEMAESTMQGWTKTLSKTRLLKKKKDLEVKSLPITESSQQLQLLLCLYDTAHRTGP